MTMPLQGICVVDWTIWQQGPVATAMLADMGAEVIKVEELQRGDPGRNSSVWRDQFGIDSDINFYFENNNRHKKSIAVDLKKAAGREVVRRLADRSDVFVQNFRKGVAARLGLDYRTLSQRNPKLIYASASGFGPEGADSGQPAFDFVGLARSGMMLTAGESDMPPLYLRGGIADQMGAIMLAYGVMTALVARERLGIGQEVDVSHLGSMLFLQGVNVAARLMTGQEFPRTSRARAASPLHNYYRCADDRWLCLAMLQSDRFWSDFCRTVGLEALAADSRFSTMEGRANHCEELVCRLDRVFATRPRAEWMKVLREAGDFIFTPVNTLADLASDLQVVENKYIDDFDHPRLGRLKVVGVPVRLSQTPGSALGPAPQLGEQTEAVLSDICGYGREEIAQLRAEHVI